MRNLSEISRIARLAEVWLGIRQPDPVELWLPMPLPSYNESEKELFLQYWYAAQTLGVNPECIELQDAIDSNPHHLESAFLYLLESKDKIGDSDHATNFLRKAFIEGWKPRKFQSFEDAKKELPWL
ncbi:hypothetical protein [Iningainema tapete]|uniref:Uncharacterized protein n=1 Tax=Iningainema tapete BLCC-T55 TaxID=2748662 RepID=A0A8J6XKX6_9CYAN|nr:hypothetical protein [Iningainema tapete]MBD2770653.1 hypothetical protein [Iningainema tapete BLCC-T55]